MIRIVAITTKALLSAPAIAQQAAPRKACCDTQKIFCMNFCKTPEGVAQGQSCPNACNERVQACYQTGVYHWRTRPAVSC